MGLFHKTDSYLGIDIGAGGMKLVELKKTKGRPQLWTYGIVDDVLDIHIPTAEEKTPEALLKEQRPTMAPVTKTEMLPPPIDVSDPRIDKYAAMLKALVKGTKAQSTLATASLPVSSIFHAVFTMPKMAPKEVMTHVMAKVAKVLPRPLEEMQVVHQVIPAPAGSEQKDLKVLVTAAPKTLVMFYTAIFQKAGLKLQELETEAFALERSLVGRDTSTVMVIDIGAERTNFFIMDQGLPLTHRTIQIGGKDIDRTIEKRLGVSPDMVSQIKYDMTQMPGTVIPKDVFLSVLDPIAKEVQYSFDIFLNQTGNQGKRPEKIIVTGGSAFFTPIIEYLRDATKMKVFVGDPWARVVYQDGLKRVLDPIGPRMSVAIGLALRNIV